MQMLIEFGCFGRRVYAKFILEKLRKLLVMTDGLGGFAHLGISPHEFTVGGFEEVVMVDGLTIGSGGGGVTAVPHQHLPQLHQHP